MRQISTPIRIVSAFFGAFGRGRKDNREYDDLFGHKTHSIVLPCLELHFTNAPYHRAFDVPNDDPILFSSGKLFLESQKIFEIRHHKEFIKSVKELDGKFGLLFYNKDRLILTTDIIGAGTVYYAHVNGTLYFSTHLGILIDILPFRIKPNWLGVVSLLLGGVQAYEETQIAGVHRLLAGQYVDVEYKSEQKGISFDKGEYFSLLDLITNANGSEVSPYAVNSLLRQAIMREDSIASAGVSLSGGQDSKGIALNCPKSVKFAIMGGEKYSIDLLGARALSQKLGMKHFEVPYDTWTLESYARETIGLYAGCVPLLSAQTLVINDWSKDLCRPLFMGFLGNPLTGDNLHGKLEIDLNHVINELLPNNSASLIYKYFKDEIKTIKSDIEKRYKYLSDLPSYKAWMYLDLKYRQATMISMSFNLSEWFNELSYPFFYRPLMVAFLSAKPEQLLRRRLFASAIAVRMQERSIAFSFRERFVRSVYLYANAVKLRKKRPVGRTFWPDVVARTGRSLDLNDYLCGETRLDQFMFEAWQKALMSKRGAPPLFGWSAPIGATFRICPKSL